MSSPKLIEEQAIRYLNQLQKAPNHSNEVMTLTKQLESIKNEEQRYVKAYGSQLLGFNDFEQLVKELRAKKLSIEKQLQEFKLEQQQVRFSMPQLSDLENFCKKALEILKSLDFEHKRAIIRELVDKIVGTQQEIVVYGYLPIVKENYVKFWSERRNCWASKCREKHAV